MKEVVRLDSHVYEEIHRARSQKQTIDLSLRITMLEALVRKLDPDHLYTYSEELSGWIRTPREGGSCEEST